MAGGKKGGGVRHIKVEKPWPVYLNISSVCSKGSFVVLLSRPQGKGQHPNMGFFLVSAKLKGYGGLRARGGHRGVCDPHSTSESSAAPVMV